MVELMEMFFALQYNQGAAPDLGRLVLSPSFDDDFLFAQWLEDFPV